MKILIALSVLLVALMSIFKPLQRTGWMLAYGFDLVHGLGFAGALAQMGVAQDMRLVNELAFNGGVELERLMVVVVAMPILAILGTDWQYRRFVLPAISPMSVLV